MTKISQKKFASLKAVRSTAHRFDGYLGLVFQTSTSVFTLQRLLAAPETSLLVKQR